jgi:pyruvate dehydrogenase E2 component (dihydrolipoamide acetyltransferase)
MPSFIEMPKLSDTMTEGTVVKWRKAVGEPVQMGDVVAEVETDKAVMELEAFGEGTLSEVYVPEGGKARIGEKLARLAAPGEGTLPKEREHPTAGQAPVGSAVPAAPANPIPPAPKAPPPQPAAAPAGTRVKASPLARKLATAKGVDLTYLTGTGPGGRIIARDIEPALAGQAAPEPAAPTPAAPTAPVAAPAPKVTAAPGDKRIPLSGMRKVIADRLLTSKTQIPHFYLNIEVDAGELLRLRAQVNAALEKAGQGKLTINDFVLRAAVQAAVKVPRVNASFAGDAVIEYANVHLSVAVAIDEGLVTPIIRDAQKKSLKEISEAVKDLANRARTKKLKPEEYQGGTLTVSNLGSYGIESFSAIINPPQALILSVGAIVKKPVVNAAGQIVPGERMSVGLSADHRVVDGAIGAQYLAELRQLLENPTLLLL